MGALGSGSSLRWTVIALCVAVLTGCYTTNDRLQTARHEIQAGDTIDQVTALLGAPPQRQVRGDGEAWQYCNTQGFYDDFLAVFFLNGRVVATESYTHAEYGDCTIFFREVIWDFQTVPASSSQAASREPDSDASPGGLSTGTGFFVSANGDFITNQHVIEGCKALYVDGARAASIVATDPINDLALLAVDAVYEDYVKIRPGGRAKLGEEVFTFGYPLAGILSSSGSFTGGHVSSLAGIADDTRHLQITTPVQAGNSGGALVDAKGELVGVVVAKLNAVTVAQSTGDVPQNVNFAIKANILISFLLSHEIDLPEPAADTASASNGSNAGKIDRVVETLRKTTRQVACEV